MNLTEREINEMIFKGANCAEFRSPLDAFTFEQLREILNSDEYKYYSVHLQDWLWNAFDCASEDA